MKKGDTFQNVIIIVILVMCIVRSYEQMKQTQYIGLSVYQEIYIDNNFILGQIEKKYYSGQKITKDDVNLVVKIVSEKYNVNEKLIRAIIMVESSYRCKIISPCGAGGLMQLMPFTAREVGVSDVFNPIQNIKGGVIYFKKLLNEFDGDTRLALASYNAGIGTVKRLGYVPRYKETLNYLEKINKYMV